MTRTMNVEFSFLLVDGNRRRTLLNAHMQEESERNQA